MNKVTVTLLVFLFFIPLSCSGILQQNEVDPWLKHISGDKPADLDVSGKWRDGTGQFLTGWGKGYLKQDQNQVRGVIGNYNIKGTVSGKDIYLVFIYGGAVYYTARMEMLEKGVLNGNYFEADDREQTKGYPTKLVKTD